MGTNWSHEIADVNCWVQTRGLLIDNLRFWTQMLDPLIRTWGWGPTLGPKVVLRQSPFGSRGHQGSDHVGPGYLGPFGIWPFGAWAIWGGPNWKISSPFCRSLMNSARQTYPLPSQSLTNTSFQGDGFCQDWPDYIMKKLHCWCSTCAKLHS